MSKHLKFKQKQTKEIRKFIFKNCLKCIFASTSDIHKWITNTNFTFITTVFGSWLLLDSRDPAGQLVWLDKELAESEKLGEAVHIIGHVPPSLADCVQVWSTEFHSLVHRLVFSLTFIVTINNRNHTDCVVYVIGETWSNGPSANDNNNHRSLVAVAIRHSALDNRSCKIVSSRVMHVLVRFNC